MLVVFTAGHTRSHDAVIRVYDESGNVIQTHEHKGDFKENMDAGRMGSISWRRRMEGRRQHEIAKEMGHASIGADAEKSRAHSGLARFACNMGASRGRGRSASRQRQVTNRAETIGGHATMKKIVTLISPERLFQAPRLTGPAPTACL
jgi:hypothetical protein